MIDKDEETKEGKYIVKLVDFGMSCIMEPDKKETLRCGTLNY